MNNERPSHKFFTWKHGIAIIIGTILGEALFQYNKYRTNGYWEGISFSRGIVLLLTLIVFMIFFIYWGNRPPKGN